MRINWFKSKNRSPERMLLDGLEVRAHIGHLDKRDLIWKVISHPTLLDKPIDDEGLILVEEMMDRIFPGWCDIFYPEKVER